MHNARFIALSLLCCLPAVADAALPTITIAAVDPNATEAGSKAAAFLITRDGDDISKSLTVPLTYSGTATLGADYVSPGATVTFGPNVPLVSLYVKPIKDTIVEGQETVLIGLAPNPAAYTLGDDHIATAIITDAGSGPSKEAVELNEIRKKLPPPDRTGSLVVTIAFDGKGSWRHPKNGAYSNMKWHHELTYTVPLDGVYSAGSGFTDIDKREVGMVPDLRRFLIGRPRDAMAPAGTACGKGSASILDESSGMEVGDPGQPPLVPFKQQIKGGGPYPSGDKTVPERDLCQTLLSFDNTKHILHLRFDGTDAHVKVLSTHNGHTQPAYNLRLQGDAADAKDKFTFDVPIAANAMNSEGTKVIDNVSTVSGPMNTTYPLSATVKWRVTLR